MAGGNIAYMRANTVEEALALGAAHPGARFLAGGTDLLTRIRCGATPAAQHLIDIKRIASLGRIEVDPQGRLCIGAAVTVAQVSRDELILNRYPALAECCRQIGSYPLRNLATVAGNICNASPCGDSSAALLALDADVLCVSAAGSREVPIEGFFGGPGLTALKPAELVTAIRLPAQTAGARFQYGRIGRRRGVDISTVAVLLVHLPALTPAHRIALLSVAPTPLRVPLAETLLDEQGAAAVERAAELAMDAANPIDDVRGSAAYRREMVGVLLRRAVASLSEGRVDQ